MQNYTLIGKLKAVNGKGKDLSDILVRASELNMKGCINYSVILSGDEIVIYEIWKSKKDHDESLNNAKILELISEAREYLGGMPETLFEGETIN